MAYAVGVVLFALGILISVCLHEAGHMFTARGFGMKVTRYFIGFGPTIFSFRRGEMEYGLKAIPAGAFVKIEGMTPQEDEEEVKPEDKHRVFWKKPVWQRTIVLVAGSVTHFILCYIILWIAASFVGVPNPDYAKYDATKAKPVIGEISACVQLHYNPKDPGGDKCGPNDPAAPAKKAGLQAGDQVTSIAGVATPNYAKLVTTTQHLPAGPTPLTYLRGGQPHTTTVDLLRAQRPTGGTAEKPKLSEVSVLGVAAQLPPTTRTYGPVKGTEVAGQLYWQTVVGMGHAVVQIPEKIPALVSSLGGGHRDVQTPISVVGAARLGGDAGEMHAWWFFLILLAQLNLFIGVFNLVPLLPLDGGHVAIAWFEKARSWLAARRGRADPGRVDYMKLMPITYAFVILFAGLAVLTIAADIINPVTLN